MGWVHSGRSCVGGAVGAAGEMRSAREMQRASREFQRGWRFAGYGTLGRVMSAGGGV